MKREYRLAGENDRMFARWFVKRWKGCEPGLAVLMMQDITSASLRRALAEWANDWANTSPLYCQMKREEVKARAMVRMMERK